MEPARGARPAGDARRARRRPVDVVVIDSGYIAEGPIVPRIERHVDYGEWFTKLDGQPGYGWVDAARESLDAGNDRRLDTLVGHAGFVAGVIAQGCPQARITRRRPQRRLRRAGRLRHADPDRGVGRPVALWSTGRPT